MEETIAKSRRQLANNKRSEKQQRAVMRKTERARRSIAPTATKYTVQPSRPLRLSLSPAIRVETGASLTNQGDVIDPVNQLLLAHCPLAWFPQLLEQIWKKLDRTAPLTSCPLLLSDAQLDYGVTNIQIKAIYSEASSDSNIAVREYRIVGIVRIVEFHSWQARRRKYDNTGT
jgi:hypothetical protein